MAGAAELSHRQEAIEMSARRQKAETAAEAERLRSQASASAAKVSAGCSVLMVIMMPICTVLHAAKYFKAQKEEKPRENGNSGTKRQLQHATQLRANDSRGDAGKIQVLKSVDTPATTTVRSAMT